MIKKNFLTKEQIIFCPDRIKRPSDIACKDEFVCPFCIENIHLTKDSLYTFFNDEIRVIENKYPLIKCEKNFARHQIIIDTKEHFKQMQDFSDEHMFYLMESIRQCFIYFNNMKNVKYIQVFKNYGENSGASLLHSHWQVLAFEYLPKKQKTIINSLKSYEKKHLGCYFCELNLEKFLIEENDIFISYCDENSTYYFEINIIPKNHLTDFSILSDFQLKELGKILKNSVKRLSEIYKNLSYNICFFVGCREKNSYHFFITIIPRMANFGGFELSTGMFVNSADPKICASMLKEINI